MDIDLLDTTDSTDPNATAASGHTRAIRVGADKSSGSGGGGALEHYLRSIRDVPVLSREETYALAAILEESEADFRSAICALPATAMLVLERWTERREAGRVTGALHARYRDGSGRNWNRVVDAHMRDAEALLAEREAAHAAGHEARLRAAGEKLAERMREADVTLELLIEIYRELEALRSAPRTRAVREARRRLALEGAPVRTELQRARQALARLDEAKQRFVRHNLRLVVKCAKRYRNMGVPFLDLIQEGSLGLMRAVEKFDRHRGFKFSTYAVWWINQSLIRVIQNTSRTVRVPSHIYERELRLGRAQRLLRQQLGRMPTREELAEELEWELEAVDQVSTARSPIASIDAPVPGTDSLQLEDVLEDEGARDPVDELDEADLQGELAELLQTLVPRERQILDWHFGLTSDEPLTLEQIGQRLGLSRERVRQLEARALGRLRERCDAGSLSASLGIELDEMR